MQSLTVLKVKLCYYSFSEIHLSQKVIPAPGSLACDEGWIFEPLINIAKVKGKSLQVFDVEVDWPDSYGGWNEEFEQVGTKLVRTEPRSPYDLFKSS